MKSFYLFNIISMKTYQQKGNDSLLIINQKTLKKVLLQNVVLLKGDINYTTFYLKYGKEKVVAHTLKFFEDYLETRGFLRVHRSFMINPNFVEKYNEEQELYDKKNYIRDHSYKNKNHTRQYLQYHKIIDDIIQK